MKARRESLRLVVQNAWRLRTTCRQCAYSLVGIPRRDGGRWCPECGACTTTQDVRAAGALLRGTGAYAAVRALAIGYGMMLLACAAFVTFAGLDDVVSFGIMLTVLYLVMCAVVGVVASTEMSGRRPWLTRWSAVRLGLDVFWRGARWVAWASVITLVAILAGRL